MSALRLLIAEDFPCRREFEELVSDTITPMIGMNSGGAWRNSREFRVQRKGFPVIAKEFPADRPQGCGTRL